jgi:hypothetical protein
LGTNDVGLDVDGLKVVTDPPLGPRLSTLLGDSVGGTVQGIVADGADVAKVEVGDNVSGIVGGIVANVEGGAGTGRIGLVVGKIPPTVSNEGGCVVGRVVLSELSKGVGSLVGRRVGLFVG